MTSGTLEDKVSALTLMVQESPLHTMKSFENLLGLAKKKSRNQALLALAAVKDLLAQSNLLPDRKLYSFAKQPGLLALGTTPMRTWKYGAMFSGGLEKRHLVMWAFEDWLKKQYFELLKTLENWCTDEVEFARSRAITIVYELLRDKPEQEENLLRLLINKLGDTASKIASRTSYLLLQLQNSHPAMKSIIIKAIEADCLFRPGQSPLAKYYAIITLNQTILGQAEAQLASQLLNIYFALFVQLLKLSNDDGEALPEVKPVIKQQGGTAKAGRMAAQKAKAVERSQVADDQLKERMVAQLLAGVNRAFPYADIDDPNFERQIGSLFKVAHSSNFGTAIQALTLIQRISSSKQYSADRFYRTLYESLLDPRLLSSSKQNMYLNLLYKSLKSDVNAKRVQAFVKRLLQTINLHEPPFITGVLHLIIELKKTFPAIGNMLNEPELDAEDEEEHFVDAPETQDAVTVPAASTVRRSTATHYDGRKRDPEYAHADKSALWDLLPMCMHFHPSISLFADALVTDSTPPPKPDPSLHTLIHFLDRFVYRNPKAKPNAAKGASIMQPMAGSEAADRLVATRRTGAQAPVNSDAFINKDAGKVGADEVFFHKYFQQTAKSRPTNKKKKSGDAEEDEEDDIWQALVDSNKDIEGPDDEEDDLSLDGLEEAYSDSDDEDGSGGDMGGVEIADFPEGEDDFGDDAGSGDEDVPDFDDDEDALLDDDDEVPDFGDGDEDGEEDAGVEVEQEDEDADKNKKKRRKIKHLPTFASADDYAAMLDNEPDDY